MLTIKNLTKRYGQHLAVDDLSLTLQRGEIFGFIGPNGAGKSTTIRATLGFIDRNSGEVFFDDKLLDGDNANLKRRIGYLPSEIELYEYLTGRQMIEYNQKFYSDINHDYVQNLIKRLNFDVDKRISSYSLGNRKKLGIILALMHNPDLIIMDEATSGLDPLMQEEVYQILREEKSKGKTIFFSSHYLDEVRKICDRIGIIRAGKLIKVDTVTNITAKQGLMVTLYLNKPLVKTQIPEEDIIINTKDVLKFHYYGDKASLMKIINQPQVVRFLVEEPGLDNIFMNYYQGER